MVFGRDSDLELSVSQSIPESTVGAIVVQGGTNSQEGRSGDTQGSGARTFIKIESAFGDADIRIGYWDSNHNYVDLELDDSVSCVVIAVGGGGEASTMASGIVQLGEHFRSIGITGGNSKQFQASTADCGTTNTDCKTQNIEP